MYDVVEFRTTIEGVRFIKTLEDDGKCKILCVKRHNTRLSMRPYYVAIECKIDPAFGNFWVED